MTTLLVRSDELIHVGRILEASGHALHAHQTIARNDPNLLPAPLDSLGQVPCFLKHRTGEQEIQGEEFRTIRGERIIRAFLQRDGT